MRAFKYSALGSILTLILFLQPTSSAARGQGPSASGHGNLTVGNGELRTFSFTAITDDEGNVIGQAQVKSRSSGSSVHLEIDCLSVDETRAVVSGRVTKVSGPLSELVSEGWTGVFVVHDNGEGSNAAEPDTISLIEFPEGPVGCAINYTPLNGERPIEAGNIQVRP